MAQYTEHPAASSSTPTAGAPGTSGWVGWIAFAGVIMVMLGMFHAVQGLVALFKDEYFLVTRSGLVVNMDYTAWGWVHLLIGVVVVLAGIAVFAGQVWARVVGTLIALASALINVTFLAAYPVWSLMMITLDIVIILALTVHGSDIKD